MYSRIFEGDGKDCMQSPTREEMMKLCRYDTVADVQEKNDAIKDAQKKNDASCKCTMQLHMYKKRMLKNKLLKGAIKLKYVPTEEWVADVLTKPLARVKFEYFQDNLGLVQKDLSQKREWQNMLDAMVSRSV